MSDSDSESEKRPGGHQNMSPSPAVLRASAAGDVDDCAVGVVDVSTSAEEESPTLRDSVVASLTSLASMSFFSSAFFHLFVWGTALLLLPLFGLEWLEFSTVEVPPISASLGDEEVLDDLPKMNVIGSVDVENDEPSSSLQELAQRLQESETAWLRSANEEALSPLSVEADGEDGGGILLKVPDAGFAVTKGSFTAFTIPAEPEPLKPYRIVIEVRLPSDVKKYRVNDLKGEVIGTDGYKQFLPYDRRAPSASRAPAANGKEIPITSSTSIDVIKNRVQIIIVVPGAQNLVKDRIKIRSRRLREDQELTLTFARRRAPKEDEPGNP
ncbi:MAG: hypothetical protein R3C17_02575 [Planctomycetaceae bacterium]